MRSAGLRAVPDMDGCGGPAARPPRGQIPAVAGGAERGPSPYFAYKVVHNKDTLYNIIFRII